MNLRKFINDIKPNKAQPRMTFDEDKLKELGLCLGYKFDDELLETKK